MSPPSQTRAVPRSRDAMPRRIRSLASGESVNVIVQPLIFFVLFEVPATLANLTGMAAVVLLLAQGAMYWLAKYLQITRQRAELPLLGVFLRLRWFNPLLLGLALLVILSRVSTTPDLATWPAVGFWAFAVLEYVNYFHVQLTPTASIRGPLPRRSRLSHDLLRVERLETG